MNYRIYKLTRTILDSVGRLREPDTVIKSVKSYVVLVDLSNNFVTKDLK